MLLHSNDNAPKSHDDKPSLFGNMRGSKNFTGGQGMVPRPMFGNFNRIDLRIGSIYLCSS